MSDWDNIDRMFDDILKDFPKKKRELMKDVGDLMEEKVIDNIRSTTTEKTGHLEEGVTKVVGSGGGYTSVKPNYNISPHAHLIESGHKIVKDGVIVGFVNGKHMYRNALEEVAEDIEKMAQNMISDVIGGANG